MIFAHPWALPSLVATALSIGLLLYVWVRPPPPALWPSLPGSLLGGFLFSAGSLVWHLLAHGPVGLALSIDLVYTGLLLLGASAWVLALRVAEVQGSPFTWGRSRWARAPVVFALLMWPIVLTHPWHDWLVTPSLVGRSDFHWLWYVNTFELHGVIAASALLFLRLARRARSAAARSQALLMVGALAVPAVCNVIYILSPIELPFDPTSLGLCVTGAVFLFGIYRRHLFALAPIDFAELLRQDTDGVLLVDRAGRLLHRNPASDRWLAPQAGAVGDSAWEVLAGRLHGVDDAGPHAAAPLDEAQLEAELGAESQPPEGRLYRVPADGRLYRVPADGAWLRVESRPIRSARGQLLCRSLRLRDETPLHRAVAERLRAEQAVQHAQKLESLGVLAGGIAHDFNNLLLAMQGNAGLAREEIASGGSRAAEFLEDVERAAERAAGLTHQLLTYAGRGSLEVAELDVSRVARDVIDLIAISVPKQIALSCRLAEGPPAVTGDASQLRQVVMNLVLNAAEAIGEREGSIVVESEAVSLGAADGAGWLGEPPWRGGRFVALRVTDSGSGMSEEVEARIFDPFFTTKATGRGLGLAATLGIVKSHHGWLRVESRPGAGTTFTVLLPAGERPAVRVEPPAPVPACAWRSDATVLIVEDEPDVASVAERILASAGMHPLVARSGDEALALHRERGAEVALVLLDLNMPGLPGEAVYRALRRASPALPILVSSGQPKAEAVARLRNGEPFEFLQKPYGADVLRQRVRALLEQRAA